MQNKKRSESIRCFISIVITAAAIGISDLIARAFFYEYSQRITPYLPLLIGTIALGLTAVMLRNRNGNDTSKTQTNTAGIRRVRVTGTIK